ncbi:hypothetical protein DFH29DRAFT_1007575 [Suillus ampliporus]|nr:hypothetical protein DFH29DRAFT_1007575 [Suillus ampliporus]
MARLLDDTWGTFHKCPTPLFLYRDNLWYPSHQDRLSEEDPMICTLGKSQVTTTPTPAAAPLIVPTTAAPIVAIPIVATPIVATPIVAIPIVATPIVATPIVAAPIAVAPITVAVALNVTTLQHPP